MGAVMAEAFTVDMEGVDITVDMAALAEEVIMRADMAARMGVDIDRAEDMGEAIIRRVMVGSTPGEISSGFSGSEFNSSTLGRFWWRRIWRHSFGRLQWLVGRRR